MAAQWSSLLASQLPRTPHRVVWTILAVFAISSIFVYSAFSYRSVSNGYSVGGSEAGDGTTTHVSTPYLGTPDGHHRPESVHEPKFSNHLGPGGPVWLIATMSPAHGIQRRAIIRATWQRLYRDDSLFRTRFVISRPGPDWMPIIAAESEAYGDIIVLPHLEENSYVANHVKSMEFYKWLTAQALDWQFVSKIDDDCFLDPFAFWTQFLRPLSAKMAKTSELRTILARRLTWGHPRGDFVFPGGQFYTMTWDMVKLLVQLYKKNPLDEYEDVMNGRLLFEADEKWDIVTLENPVAFDYADEHGEKINGLKTAWAVPGDDLTAWVHGVGPGAINPHKMKTDEQYLQVAACYGPAGLLDKNVAVQRIGNDTLQLE